MTASGHSRFASQRSTASCVQLGPQEQKVFSKVLAPLSKAERWVVRELHSQLCCSESMKLSKRGIRDKRRRYRSWRLCAEYKLSRHSLLPGKQRLKGCKFRGVILGLIEQLPATTTEVNPACESLQRPYNLLPGAAQVNKEQTQLA